MLINRPFSISDLINLGFGAASNQGNLLTGIGAAEAGGIVGAANARQQGIGNLSGDKTIKHQSKTV